MTIEALRAEWRRDLFSHHPSEMDRHRNPVQGECDGVWMKACSGAPYGAYMKPTVTARPFPIAAIEKIVADLAFDVGVLAVPVLLYDSRKQFGAVENRCCVSPVLHPEVVTWDTVWSEAVQQSPAGIAVRGMLARSASQIAVLDLWIGNQDRDHGGNIVLSEDPENPARNGFVAIDHSSAMNRNGAWSEGGWKLMTPPPFQKKLRHLLDREIMLHTTQRVAALSESEISGCVERIPDEYMEPAARELIVEALVGRKSLLEGFVSQKMQRRP